MKPNLRSNVYLQAQRAKKINLTTEKVNSIAANNAQLTELNRWQMRRGLTNEGNLISPEYSDEYYYYKKDYPTYHAPAGVPDLFATGEFQAKMQLMLNLSGVEFVSVDSKTKRLVKKYGQNIFGLTAKNMSTGIILVTNSYIKMIVRALKHK